MKKFNLIKIVVSFSLLFSMLNLTIVKAVENMTLMRNDQLTDKYFDSEKDDYFVTNNINSLQFDFSNNYNNLKLDGDLNADFIGSVESISTEKCQGFVGFYEGELEDGTFLSVSVTYSDNKMLAALTVGYMGDEWFGTTYFGETSEKIKQIDDVYSKKFITQNQLNEKQSIEVEELDELRVLDNYSTKSTTSIDVETRLKGSSNATIEDSHKKSHTIGRLNVYHSNELSNEGQTLVYAKVNTARSGVRDYISAQGYNTTAIFIVPTQFDISIKSNDAKLYSSVNAYKPENNKKSFSLPIPYINSSGNFATVTLSITTSSTTVTEGFSSGAESENYFTWVMKKLGGWGQTEFDGTSSTKAGMCPKVEYVYQGNDSSVNKTFTCTGKIKYNIVYYPDPEEDTQKTLSIQTNQMKVDSTIKIVP